MTLEEQLFEDIRAGRQIEIERSLLVMSGCDTEEKIAEYQDKIQRLSDRFDAYKKTNNVSNNAISTGKALLDFIWQKEGSQYKDEMNNLADCVDAQLKQNKRIGNCSGLSFLYAAIGLRQGLKLKVLYNPEHVLLRQECDDETRDIETTHQKGYGVAMHDDKRYRRMMEGNMLALVAVAYLNRATAKRTKWDLKGSDKDFARMREIESFASLRPNTEPVYATPYSERKEMVKRF